MHKSVYFLLIVALIVNCQKNPKNTLSIHFKMVNADSLKIIQPSGSNARPIKNNQFLETISAFPKDYSIKNIYQFHIERLLVLGKMFKKDSSFKAYLKQKALPTTIQFIEKVDTSLAVDDIVSAALLNNKQGEEFFIFDANNDEDLSNDQILPFKPFPTDFLVNNNNRYELAENTVSIEYFDGHSIKTQRLLLGYFKVYQTAEHSHGFFAKRQVPLGSFTIDNEKYDCILFTAFPDITFKNIDFLWIDLNHNFKHDMFEDFYHQLYEPFTLKKSTYRARVIDPFGFDLILEKLDPKKFPPIAEGLPCPDFNITLTDSTSFSPKLARGKYLVLDFWMCNDQYCDLMSHQLMSKLKNKERLIWLSCPLDSSSYRHLKSMGAEPKADGRKFVASKDIKPLRKLFQTRFEKILIVVNPQGKIELMEWFKQDKTSQLLQKAIAQN